MADVRSKWKCWNNIGADSHMLKRMFSSVPVAMIITHGMIEVIQSLYMIKLSLQKKHANTYDQFGDNFVDWHSLVIEFLI